jgi:hypothetical protein
MSQEGFFTSPWVAGVFFRYCQRYNITSRQERVALMRRLVRKKRVTYIRDPKTFLSGKNVLRIDTNNDTKEPPNV